MQLRLGFVFRIWVRPGASHSRPWARCCGRGRLAGVLTARLRVLLPRCAAAVLLEEGPPPVATACVFRLLSAGCCDYLLGNRLTARLQRAA